jgi:hypothetical protein
MYKAFKLGLLALGLAVFIDLVLYGQAAGLNVPVTSLAFLGTTYFAMYLGGHKLPRRAHVAAAFSFLFAVPFALGTSDEMLMLSTLGFLSSHLLFALFALGQEARFSHPLEIFWNGTGVLGLKLLGRIDFFSHIKPPSLSQKHWALGKGLLVLVPLLVIFIALFASADPVFSSYFDNLGRWLGTWTEPEEIVVQIIVIGTLFLGFALFFAAAAYERYAHTAEPERKLGWTLESKVVLTGLTILFGLFLLLQGSVMFGGSAAFGELNLTYAEYARQGFNQLIFASTLVAIIVLTLRRQHGEKSDQLLTALHSIFIVETLLLLISAALRLNLYIDTYGYTDARFLAYWTIITIGVLLALLLANVIQRESQTILMRRALVVLGVSALVFCYSMPDALAVKFNLRRAAIGHAVDLRHLSAVSGEALPAIAEAIATNDRQTFAQTPTPSLESYCAAIQQNQGLNPDPAIHAIIEDYHARQQLALTITQNNLTPHEKISQLDWRDWNYSRVRANDILPMRIPEWLETNALPPEQACAGMDLQYLQ